ncbi:MAG: type II toxin-antitoxin system HipA family toxin [Bdellovibrionales bacterium]|nr:type II toxin-antitoxin system HipA family toxin [Bdellovibrionales bacterium]
MTNTLNVFYEKTKIGELKRDKELTLSFQYSHEWINNPNQFPLSLAMPVQEKPFGNKVTISFFENLLPEGNIRKALADHHKLENPYEFLKKFGQDCAGAILITENDTSPALESNQKSELEINIKNIYNAIEDKQSVAEAISEENPGYLSIAGAQDKFPAIYKNKKFYLPRNGAPTTHIIKVPIFRSGVKESVFNEYYCMQLAKLVGLNVPRTRVLDNGEHALLIVDRYDRTHTKDKDVIRIHQQDFCQAQGITSEMKYESKGGPSLKNNYDLIVKHVDIHKRKDAIYSFIDWLCFNLLIGNNDSHSKNISFILSNHKIQMAPFYDLLCTAIYPKLSQEFSFSIGDRMNFSKISLNQIYLLEESLGVKKKFVVERMLSMKTKLLAQKEDLANKIKIDFPRVKIAHRISKLIQDRCKSIEVQGIH